MTAPLSFAQHNSIGVPPDGAGKRFGTHTYIFVEYGNGSAPVGKNATVEGAVSGAKAFVTGLVPGSLQLNGTLLCIWEQDTPVVNGEVVPFELGEDILLITS